MKLADLARGVVLGGRFRLIDRIGTGSYADVWLAETIGQVELPRRVALKIFNQEQQNRGEKALLMELMHARKVTSPRVVEVFGADRLDGIYCMWMAHAPGTTLQVRSGDPDHPTGHTLPTILAWMAGLAEGLSIIHGLNPPLVHGDIKPDNIVIDDQNEVCLLDFGTSKLIEDRCITTEGRGALLYGAPELLGLSVEPENKRYVASDIYSFGVVAYRMLTGRLPYRNESELYQRKPFPRPRELNDEIPIHLEALVLKCLENDPGNRYQSGIELYAAFQIVREVILAARPSGPSFPVGRADQEPTPNGIRSLRDLEANIRNLLDEGKVEEALESIQQLAERTSTSTRVLLLYAASAKRLGHHQVALQVLDRARQWCGSHTCDLAEQAEIADARGDSLVFTKRYEEAIKEYEWLLEQQPRHRWYRYRLAVCLAISGRAGVALPMLLALAQEHGTSANLSAKIGLCYLQIRKHRLATEYFNEALMRDAYEPHALFHLARIKWLEGNQNQALDYLRRLRGIDSATDMAKELGQLLGAPK